MKRVIDVAFLSLLSAGVSVLIGVASLSACGRESQHASGQAPSSSAVSSDGTPVEMVEKFVQSNGIQRRYLILAPSVDGDPKLPMLIVMHGRYFSADATHEVGGFDEFALANHFILVFPQGVGNSWNIGTCCPPASDSKIDDVQFISDLIDDVAASNRLDRARVYAAGISNGGAMAYRLACERPDLIAAVGSVAGNLPTVDCVPGRPVPVVEIHGMKDPLAPYAIGIAAVAFWAANNSCSLRLDEAGLIDTKVTFAGTEAKCEQYRACQEGAAVELCSVFEGGHNWPGAAIDLCHQNYDGWINNWWWCEQTNQISAHEVIWNFVKEYHLNP